LLVDFFFDLAALQMARQDSTWWGFSLAHSPLYHVSESHDREQKCLMRRVYIKNELIIIFSVNIGMNLDQNVALHQLNEGTTQACVSISSLRCKPGVFPDNCAATFPNPTRFILP
jgi:hypothetical protein